MDLRKSQVLHRMVEKLREDHGHPGQPCQMGPPGPRVFICTLIEPPIDRAERKS